MKFYIVLFLLCIAFVSCSDGEIEKEDANELAVSTENVSSPVLFEPFNNIENMREKLSQSGIGQLHAWKSDEAGGYMSITPYYEFGSGIMKNNLAYYLTSEDPNRIYVLSLVLNIHNKSERKKALQKFSFIINQTRQALDLENHSEMISLALNPAEKTIRHESFIEQLILEQTRIETWKYVIQTN